MINTQVKKARNIYYTTLMGGFLVVLPTVILFLVFKWIFLFILEMISPVTKVIMKTGPMNEWVAGVMAIVVILMVCFLIGVIIKTRWGLNTHQTFEDNIMRYAPGYNLIKETINIFLGRKTQPFSKVALVRIFATPTLMTALITDEHPDGSFTVFVPTAPNPTSGNIYHLKQENVFLVDVPVEEAIRSILGCGAGSTRMVEMSTLDGKLGRLDA
ncbi:MAG: DUF502 domain-containing protein [Rhodothermaceae bacterium]|nr:DUF502 domain-containing protein [Rhodothermaceae bacterium]